MEELTIGPPDGISSIIQDVGGPDFFQEETILPSGQSEHPGGPRYQIISEIGKGATGRVFLAKDLNVFHRKVAIKRISLDRFNLQNPSGTSGQEVLQNFMAEPRAQAGIGHSNVVHIYDCGIDDQGMYIVMEYVAGGSLQQKIDADAPLETRKALSMAIELCDALSEVHSRGMVHRDIKPRNILLTERGTPKLSDFGLVLERTTDDHRPSGTFMGTMAYMSPEQRIDSSSVDAKSDIYSLGAALYACLTGLSPEHYDLEKLPEKIRSVVATALEENPTHRYADAGAFKTALQELLPQRTGTGNEAQYPCYHCENPAPYTSLYCPHCGKKLSALREAVEQQFDNAIEQSTMLVEAGDFDQARRLLEMARGPLCHAHFSHIMKILIEQLTWVDEKEADASARNKVLEQRLAHARGHLHAAEIEAALKLAEAVAREPSVCFASVADEARRIQAECELLLSKRARLQKKITEAKALGQKYKYTPAFHILDEVIDEKETFFEQIRQEGLVTKQRLAAHQELERTAEAQGQLSTACNALAMGNLGAAITAVNPLRQTKAAYLSRQREDAQGIVDQCNVLLAEKEALAESLEQAKVLAGGRQFDHAIQLIDPILQHNGAAFESEREAAEKLKTTYVAEARKEVRSHVKKLLESAKETRWRYKEGLVGILEMKGDFIADLQKEAYGVLRRRSWSAIFNTVLAYIVFALIGVGCMFIPHYSFSGQNLWIIAQATNLRPKPNAGARLGTLAMHAEVTAQGIALTPAGSPWVYVRSKRSNLEGYVWANVLSRKRGGKPLFKTGTITNDTVIFEKPPVQTITISNSMPVLKSGTKVSFVNQRLGSREEGAESKTVVWYEVKSRNRNGWVDYSDVRMSVQRYPESVAPYLDAIPALLVCLLALIAVIIFKKVEFLRTIKSLRLQMQT